MKSERSAEQVVNVQHVSLDRYEEDGPTYYAIVVDGNVRTGILESDTTALILVLRAAGIPILGNVVSL